jgi:hypothetical protein
MRPRVRRPFRSLVTLATLATRGTFAALVALVACRDPTGSAPSVVAAQRARWTALGITSYQYDYEVTGFFINFAGRRVHLVVRNGAVQSATDAATGQPMTQPLTQWPTVERLFDEAAGAARVTYDARYHYPTEIDVSGPPDASGSVLASDLVPLP